MKGLQGVTVNVKGHAAHSGLVRKRMSSNESMEMFHAADCWEWRGVRIISNKLSRIRFLHKSARHASSETGM